MDAQPLRAWTVVFDRPEWQLLFDHLFRSDDEEHGAVLTCGVVETADERRLLVREVLLARDGVDYVPSRRAHRMLTADSVAYAVDKCSRDNLAYLAVHNHGGERSVAFSHDDLRSHERGYPALLDITQGGPVGALVFARRAVAGDIWEPSGRANVARTVVLGPRREVFTPAPRKTAGGSAATVFDRQTRLFGTTGQALLRQLKVGIVGAGGAGSMLNQALAHLGVGEILIVDDEVVERTNLPRLVGACPLDAADEEAGCGGTPKVEVARRLALSVNPGLRYTPIRGNVVDKAVASQLLTCDALFLAADSMQARYVANAIAHQFLIPCFQVGAKVQVAGGMVTDAFAVSRTVGPSGLCMCCEQLISPTKLAEESYSPEERRRMQYVEGIAQPSVITMNAMSTALALNDFLFMMTGLHTAPDLAPRWYHFLERQPAVEARGQQHHRCDECGTGEKGRRARGARFRLPLRESGPALTAAQTSGLQHRGRPPPLEVVAHGQLTRAVVRS